MNWIDQVLKSDKRLAIPIMTNPGVEALGKTVRDAVTNGRVQYEALKYLSETYDVGACTTIMDLTVEAEAFGAKVQFSEDEVPTVVGRLISNRHLADALNIPDMTAGRIPQYLLAARLAAENIKEKPVLCGCIGPFSLAGRLYDMSEIMMGIYTDPETVTVLLSKCTSFLTRYCKNLKNTGAAGVIMAEPAAGLLSNEDSLEFSSKYIRKIVEAVQDDNFAVILHNCGNVGQCTDAMIESGAKGLHFGNKVNMVEVLERCPSDLVIMGNLDPVSVFKQATEKDVFAAARELLKATKDYRNFVISSGCDLPPHVPKENIMAFFGAVRTYNEMK